MRIGLVALAAVLVAWFTWPHPTVEIVVEPGGRAFVQAGRGGRWSRRPLPDTIVVPLASGRATLRVSNRDGRWQQLGVFGAGAGQTRDYVMTGPAVLTGACSAHPSTGRLTYLVH